MRQLRPGAGAGNPGRLLRRLLVIFPDGSVFSPSVAEEYYLEA